MFISDAHPAFALQKSKEFKVIQQYIKATANHGKLIDVFEINRHGADKRFDTHKVGVPQAKKLPCTLP